MKLKRMVLRNFRNYTEQEFMFNDKFNFIYGNNGHGKTNILEGMTYTTFGKSFLGSAEADCVKFGEQEFFVEAEFENDIGNREHVAVNYSTFTKAKLIHKNKEKVSALSAELFGKFPLVFLSPKSLSITYGNPSDRRKFFDILISQSSRLYLDYLRELAKIIRQKNALLRDYSIFRKYSTIEMKNLLNSYNEKLTDVSSNIVFKRLNFLSEFESFFVKNFSMLLSHDHFAYINYYSDMLGNIEPESLRLEPDNIRHKIEEYIYKKSEEEISRGMSLAGPQRDDYIFRLKKSDAVSGNRFELKNFASQGEHKTFIVALKLSEYDYLKNKKSTSPVLLLDDVLSELDESRVSCIVSHLRDYGQIFLTTTEKAYSENLEEFYDSGDIKIFRIEHGKVA